MADFSPLERLQPCLLDRLIDEQPDNKLESRHQRVVSIDRYKAGVIRDISWLLNSQQVPEIKGIRDLPHVQKSVLNAGLRPLHGAFSERGDTRQVEREIKEALLRFEPRLDRNSLQVKLLVEKERQGQGAPHLISLQISGDLWAQPFPEKLFTKTAVDLETGQFTF